jgi:hypothetical protein
MVGSFDICRCMKKSTLTVKIVEEILATPLSVSNVQLGKKYGVANSTIARIRNRERWLSV